MKYIAIIMFVLMASSVYAEPFLVCDSPEEQVDSYNIYKDGVKIGTSPAQPNGSLRYDLTGITPGRYTWTAEAANVWGVSDLSDPYISPALAQKPSNVGLTK
jgi:hypothetical protein